MKNEERSVVAIKKITLEGVDEETINGYKRRVPRERGFFLIRGTNFFDSITTRDTSRQENRLQNY